MSRSSPVTRFVVYHADLNFLEISKSYVTFEQCIFYPHNAVLARVLAIIVCLSVCLSVCVSVCLSVTGRYYIRTAKHRITQETPRDSTGILAFWCQQSPFPLKIALNVKSLISTNRKSTTHSPTTTSHRWTVYVTPKSPQRVCVCWT